jgi:hypothetical protein
MKTRCLSVTLAAIVVGLSGATARGIQDKIPEIPTVRSMAAKSVTVTGCVGRGTAPDSYILTTVSREGEATGKDASRPETLLLSAAHIDISKHVGHQVSVTGMDAATSQAIWITGATDVKPATESTMTKTGAKVPAGFIVKSLTIISDTCLQAGD